jgi:hypothetical protein
VLPSLQLGCLGTITPLLSSPPDLKSMFDFGIAGPLAGMIASLLMFTYGLLLTNTFGVGEVASLPVLPIDLLRSSALGGGMIELILGKGALTYSAGIGNSVLALHSLAIAGFVGMIINALALLPVGSKCGSNVKVFRNQMHLTC